MAAEATRTRWLPGEQPFDVELVAADVPAFGCRRYRLTPSDPVADVVDDGRVIEAGDVRVAVDDDGTLRVRFGEREYRGLLAIEDSGDRGDSYDFDPVDSDPGAVLESVECQRHTHPSGIAWLAVRRRLRVPEALDPGRERRTAESAALLVAVEAAAPGVPRVDLAVGRECRARPSRAAVLSPEGRPRGSKRRRRSTWRNARPLRPMRRSGYTAHRRRSRIRAG